MGRWTLCHAEESDLDHEIHCEVSEPCTAKPNPLLNETKSNKDAVEADVFDAPIDMSKHLTPEEKQAKQVETEEQPDPESLSKATVRSSFDVPADNAALPIPDVRVAREAQERAHDLERKNAREMAAEAKSMIDATGSMRNAIHSSGKSRIFSMMMLAFFGVGTFVLLLHFSVVTIVQRYTKSRNEEMVTSVLDDKAKGSNVWSDDL